VPDYTLSQRLTGAQNYGMAGIRPETGGNFVNARPGAVFFPCVGTGLENIPEVFAGETELAGLLGTEPEKRVEIGEQIQFPRAGIVQIQSPYNFRS